MGAHRWHKFLTVAACVSIAASASAQDRDPQVRQGGALIIIDGNRILLDEVTATTSELLPSPQELRTVIINPAIRELVTQLDADAFVDREKATRSLIDLRVDEMQLYAVLERGNLSAEQRHRLLHVVRERLTNAPRGALGIRMDVAAQGRIAPGQEFGANDGVTILEVIAGMPAEKVLRVGDVVTHISQTRIATPDDLINLVQGRRPGDVIALVVQRPKRDEEGVIVRDGNGAIVRETLELEIALGSHDDLHDPGIPAPPTRLELERRRLVSAVERRYGGVTRPIEVIRR